MALKFSRNSFWPAGDERARTLYTVAYFVFCFVLIPAPPTSRLALAIHATALLLLSLLLVKMTFWLFRKILSNVDATLGQST